MNDLLARIAKALEDGRTEPDPVIQHLGLARAAQQLLPEAAQALKIAVEALDWYATANGGYPRGHCGDYGEHAREAISRLTSEAGETVR